MVSLYKALTKSQRTEEFEASSKKRKWEEPFADEFFKDHIILDSRKSTLVNPHLENPFASHKWCQYFSIQSGQIQLCNTKVDWRTTEESKRSQQTPSGHMSLDLELNLTCESQRKIEDSSYDSVNKKQNSGSPKSLTESSNFMKDLGGLNGSASLLSSEGDYKEMVATVCMRCHMLVMLCKSSPACPNCKFMHPPDQNPSKFLKGSSSFLPAENSKE